MNNLVFGLFMVVLVSYSISAVLEFARVRIKNKKQKNIVDNDLKGDK